MSDQATVTIVCNAPVHAEPWEVYRMQLSQQDDGRHIWVSGSRRLKNPATAPADHPNLKGFAATSANLVGDRYLTSEDRRSDPTVASGADFRLRLGLRCEGCGDGVPVRYEKLTPILDVLASAGVNVISLCGLRERLKR